jgi:Flp pilus assembly protein TadB
MHSQWTQVVVGGAFVLALLGWWVTGSPLLLIAAAVGLALGLVIGLYRRRVARRDGI